MRRRKVIIGILALVVCAVLAVVFWPEKPEPVYKGRKLSEWVRELTVSGIRSTDKDAEIQEAIVAIGTNGFPFYMEWLSYQPNLIKKGIMYSAGFANGWFDIPWHPYAEVERAMGVQVAFSILGAQGQPAIPQLNWYATNSTSESVREGAMGCLGEIGRPSIPILLILMTNKNPQIRQLAVGKACRFGRNKSAVAQMTALLQDPDRRVRAMATNGLDWIKRYPMGRHSVFME
jgi:hypothetical protein